MKLTIQLGYFEAICQINMQSLRTASEPGLGDRRRAQLLTRFLLLKRAQILKGPIIIYDLGERSSWDPYQSNGMKFVM